MNSGKTRFENTSNTTKVQEDRVDAMISQIRNQKLDGIGLEQLKIFDTLQSRASMLSNKAMDASGLVGDFLQALPYTATLKFHELFATTYNSAKKADEGLESWTNTDYG